MPIRVLCPQGHALQVRDDLAGKVGRCPICKSVVRIPIPAADDFPEDAIMHILGTPAPRPRSEVGDGTRASSVVRTDDHHGPPKKSCAKCNREISAGTHICPFCHTYIASLSDP